MHMFGVLYRIV